MKGLNLLIVSAAVLGAFLSLNAQALATDIVDPDCDGNPYPTAGTG